MHPLLQKLKPIKLRQNWQSFYPNLVSGLGIFLSFEVFAMLNCNGLSHII